MRINNEDLLEVNGTRSPVSLAESTSLKPVWLGHICLVGIQLVFTGTPDGVFKLQVSADKGDPSATGDSQMYANVDHWTDVLASPVTVDEAGDIYWDFQNISSQWIRVVYTAAGAGSGTPTLTHARTAVKGA